MEANGRVYQVVDSRGEVKFSTLDARKAFERMEKMKLKSASNRYEVRSYTLED